MASMRLEIGVCWFHVPSVLFKYFIVEMEKCFMCQLTKQERLVKMAQIAIAAGLAERPREIQDSSLTAT